MLIKEPTIVLLVRASGRGITRGSSIPLIAHTGGSTGTSKRIRCGS